MKSIEILNILNKLFFIIECFQFISSLKFSISKNNHKNKTFNCLFIITNIQLHNLKKYYLDLDR